MSSSGRAVRGLGPSAPTVPGPVRAPVSGSAELAGPRGGRRDRIGEGGADGPVLEHRGHPPRWCHRGRSPRARSAAGVVVALAEQPGGTQQGLGQSVGRHVRGQPDEHAGLDQGLGHQEHVRRARTRTAR